ncbi:Protein S100-A7A, partial [Galemys pyrenaicus]
MLVLPLEDGSCDHTRQRAGPGPQAGLARGPAQAFPEGRGDIGITHIRDSTMGSTPAEKAIQGTIDLFHKHSGKKDTIAKPDLMTLMKENFPTFLAACVSRGLLLTAAGAWLWQGTHR